MQYTKILCFAAGAAFGAGTLCFINSGKGKRAAVAIASRGLELRDRVAELTERARESADDVIAEAMEINKQKAAGNTEA
ncbi:hypothetical protein FACS1894216_08630 [Synergistales bacterium]|nr:hypothetical protein FACS1894216_08630 [Synergistales bacterium]